MKENKAAIMIAIGLVGLGLALGLCVMQGLSSMADNKRTVDVRGLSECEVKANLVTWPVVYRVIGNDMQSVYAQIEEGNRTITKYLTSNGLTKDDFSPMAPKVLDKKAERYVNENVQVRYMATAGIIVTSDKVDVVNKLIQDQGELLKQGVAVLVDDYEYNTIYEYTSLNDIKPQMIAEATQNAREAANKFAEDSGSKVGKIMSASQGQFSISDRDPYTPSIKRIRVVTTMSFAIN